MTHRNPRSRRRNLQGFTLVELMVALALIVFIMAILSQAFVAATTSFRNLKAAADLAERLRTVTGLLQRELAADHFEGKKRLSSPTFWVTGPPEQGYFSIYAGTQATAEGTDVSGVPSTRTAADGLAFTVKRRGNDLGDFFTTNVPAVINSSFGPVDAAYQVPGANVTLYNYPWAEVAYFMVPNGSTANGMPLFNLFHRQRLAVLDNTLVPPQGAGTIGSFPEVSCFPDPTNAANLYFNNPTDLTVPNRRFGNPAPIMPQLTSGGTLLGPAYPTLASQGQTGTMQNADLLLTDVISFEVRVLLGSTNPPASTAPFAAGQGAPLNPPVSTLAFVAPDSPAQPFLSLWDPTVKTNFPTTNSTASTMNVRVFDTWSQLNDPIANFTTWNTPGTATSIPMWNAGANTGPTILAIQVTIRIWDARTQLTRQTSIVQTM